MKYPARLKPSPHGGYVVWFRDIPEANTRGDSQEKALAMAVDSLLAALELHLAARYPLPEPSPMRAGDVLIALPASLSLKVALVNEVVKSKLNHADLARAMGVHPRDVARLFQLRHTTKLDTIVEAFKALGLELDFTVTKATA